MAQRADERRAVAVGRLALISSALLIGLGGCVFGLWTIRRRVVAPVRSLTASIGRLAQREFNTEVATMRRADEFGAMAKTNCARASRLTPRRQISHCRLPLSGILLHALAQ
jgi:nitrate/nitrite-specific signal transduction histidine kinase